MTSQSRVRRTWVPAALVPIVLSAVAACSGPAGVASHVTRSPAGTPVATLVATASPAALAAPAAPIGAAPRVTVTSSIADGPLTRAVEWTAQVAGSADMVIDRVEFLLDGEVAWIEHNPPYTFNDDGNVMMPWVLTPGSHELAINAVTSTGLTGSTQVTVTTDRPPVPAVLLDRKFARTMPAGGLMPAGDWHLRFGADGVILVDDPLGGGANEGFQAAEDGTLSLYGPANWVEAVARQGSFCDYAEGAVGMRWEIKGTELTLSAIARPDPCPDRAFLFVGTWRSEP